MTHPFLSNLQRFCDLSEGEKLLLLDAVQRTKTFHPPYNIGVESGEALVLMTGWALRYVMLANGVRQTTAMLLAGDFCDDNVLLSGETDRTIAAMTDCEVAFIPRSTMLNLFERPGIAKALWGHSLAGQIALRKSVANIATKSAQQATAYLICDIHARLSEINRSSGLSFHWPLTQQAVGEAVGMTAVHINRVLRSLREQGLITVQRGHMEIHNLEKLRRVGGYAPDANYERLII